MKSLHGQYLKERENKEIIESEKGFATFFFENDYVYLEDIFVNKKHRRSGECYKMADEVAKIAKEKGYKKMLGSVCPSAPSSTESLQVLINYGFKLASSTDNMIYFIKNL